MSKRSKPTSRGPETVASGGSWLRAVVLPLCAGVGIVTSGAAWSQEHIAPAAAPPEATAGEDAVATPSAVGVDPVDDAEIERRLLGIFEGIQRRTDRFTDVGVEVEDGVIYLSGRTTSLEHKQWATQLAQKVEDAVAVVNRMELAEGAVWNLAPARLELRELWRQTVQALPLALIGLVILATAWSAAGWVARGSRRLLARRVENQILRDVASKAAALAVFLLGLYLVLRVAGLTRLAVTVLGGTGLAGLIVGIAFRDIAENFLASLLISRQNPFRPGDLIEIEGHTGYVQKVTTRGTVLLAFDGSYVQIPNSTVYKSTIINYTANPNMRLKFTIGIGYGESIPEAQEVALRVLREHPAILVDPEPMVVAERLGPAAVDLGVYFWIDVRRHSFLRVKSAAMRLVKRAFQDEGISLPDESREIIFPDGVPVRMVGAEGGGDAEPRRAEPAPRPSALPEPETACTPGEADLKSEAVELESQARRSPPPEEGSDLLSARRRADEPRAT